MKLNWKKITLIILSIFFVCIIVDVISIYTRNKPIFAIQKENGINKTYKGLLYDTYNCVEYSLPQIKFKWVKYSCSININNNNVIGKIVDIKDAYLVIEGVSDNNYLKYKNIAHVELSELENIKGANNLIIGQLIKLKPIVIKEIYPSIITTKEIEIISIINDFEIINETYVCDMALENIYEDDNYKYYLSCIMSDTLFIKFNNGKKYTIKEALNNNLVTTNAIIDKGFNLIKEPKYVISLDINNDQEIKEVLSFNNNMSINNKLYYYGLNKVNVNVNDKEYELSNYIKDNKITIDNIINDMELIETYRDGGSKLYKSKQNNNYKILKCNIVNGNKDIYIGNMDLRYENSFCK